MAIDPALSVRDEILRIRTANASRDPWAVLGIPPRSTYKEIKSAQRKWIRRLHPDRWYAVTDDQLRREIQEAFYQVQSAYFESLKRCVAAYHGGDAHQGPITPLPPVSCQPVQERVARWFQRLLAYLFHRTTAKMA